MTPPKPEIALRFADEVDQLPTLEPLWNALQDKENSPSYFSWALDHSRPGGVIVAGNIWFGVPLQRTTGATEAIYLLARHAFDDDDWPAIRSGFEAWLATDNFTAHGTQKRPLGALISSAVRRV